MVLLSGRAWVIHMGDNLVVEAPNMTARRAGRSLRSPAERLRHAATKLRRNAGESIEAVSSFLDHSSLAVTTTYLRRLEGQEDRTWRDVAVAIGV